MAEGERFSPYECVLRARLVLGTFATAFFGVGGVLLLTIAARRDAPLVLDGVFRLSAGQAQTLWIAVGVACLALGGFALGHGLYQQRRPRRLRIDRDHLALTEVATRREQRVRYAEVTEATRQVLSRVRVIRVRHPGGVLQLDAALFPSNEVFDQAARLIIERVKAARARAPAPA